MREVLPTPEEISGDPEMIHDLNVGMVSATIAGLHAMGADYAAADRDRMINTAAMDYPYMPPFVGTEEEAEMLGQYLATLIPQKGGER